MEDAGRSPAAWAAMSGDWSFRGSSAEYTRLEDASQPIGVALSSARIRNGRVSARIRLGDPAENAGRILLGYNTVTDGYFLRDWEATAART